jgi:hypothetical protein
MGKPRIDWQGQKLYFHDAAGGVWRVYDCLFVAHRSRAVPLSDPRAVLRTFVRDDGTRRILRFDGASARAISALVLARQLEAAEPAPAERHATRSDAPEAEAS